MKMKKMTAALVALAVLCLGLGSWAVMGQIRVSKLNAELEKAQAGGVENLSAVSEVNVENPDAVAAEFEGGIVTAGEAAKEYAVISTIYQRLGMNEADYAENAKMTVLEGLVENKVLEMKAKELGLYEMTDEQMAEIEARVKQEFEDNVRYYMDYRFDESKTDEEVRAETIEYLNANGSSYEEMLEEARQSAWQERLREYVTADLTVSDEQMQAFYQSQLESAELTYGADFSAYEMDAEAGRAIVWNPEGVRRVDSIFIPFDESQSADYLSIQAAIENGDTSRQGELDGMYEALKPKAQAALDRLNGGEDFAALMAEYGTLSENGSYVSERSKLNGDDFRIAAMKLSQIGDISDIVKVEGGLCILRYQADVPAGAVPFEDVKDALKEIYQEEIKSSQYNATVVGWIQAANAKYYPEVF